MTSRKHRSKAEWRNLIEQQKRSGLNGVAFCEQWELSRKTFYRHRKLLKEKTADSVAGQFIKVNPEPVKMMPLSESQWKWLLSGYDVLGHEPLNYAHCAG